MSNEERKRIVSDGLARRREERQQAEKEARLEEYEQDMIEACNIHCADAKQQRQLEETGRINRQIAQNRKEARAQAKAQEAKREENAMDAIRAYIYVCIGTVLAASWTPLPWYGAVALAAGLAVFPAAYIFRLYYPIEGGEQ